MNYNSTILYLCHIIYSRMNGNKILHYILYFCVADVRKPQGILFWWFKVFDLYYYYYSYYFSPQMLYNTAFFVFYFYFLILFCFLKVILLFYSRIWCLLVDFFPFCYLKIFTKFEWSKRKPQNVNYQWFLPNLWFTNNSSIWTISNSAWTDVRKAFSMIISSSQEYRGEKMKV